MGFDETHEIENHRTSRFLQLFFSSACVQNDPQYARLLASSIQSGKSVGISTHQSRARCPVATQEGTEASCCTRKARYTPCDRSSAGTYKIHRYPDGSGFSADR